MDPLLLCLCAGLTLVLSIQDLSARVIQTIDLLFLALWFGCLADQKIYNLALIILIAGVLFGLLFLAEKVGQKKMCGSGDVWLLAVFLSQLPADKWPIFFIGTGLLGVLWHYTGIQKPKPTPMIFVLTVSFWSVYFF